MLNRAPTEGPINVLFLAYIFCFITIGYTKHISENELNDSTLMNDKMPTLTPLIDNPFQNNQHVTLEQTDFQNTVESLQVKVPGDDIFEVQGERQKAKTTENNLYTNHFDQLEKIDWILSIVFYAFILIAFIYDAVRVSKEARRRSNAVAAATLKKKQPPPVEPQLTSYKCDPMSDFQEIPLSESNKEVSKLHISCIQDKANFCRASNTNTTNKPDAESPLTVVCYN
ncbi:uncharacterized protein LOC109615859 [Esox lucius]|uniref:uncharacterized protein LOC109615859 n=1 Tax=Esox lucius TaxID=8010 RepID=UPI001476B35A|nr:uncharacterized protein LOC109615859 [Esox lucius]